MLYRVAFYFSLNGIKGLAKYTPETKIVLHKEYFNIDLLIKKYFVHLYCTHVQPNLTIK